MFQDYYIGHFLVFAFDLDIAMTAAAKLVTIDYKVFGRVQGVFFRKFTHKEAVSLKLVGWVMNHDDGTVVGQAQGTEAKIKAFKTWLQTVGSPKSKIERVEFKNDNTIDVLQFDTFEIRK
jgi:acylphosphatase